MELLGNYWDEAPNPASKDEIRAILVTVFKELRYYHHKAKVVIDYSPNDIDPTWCRGMSRSARLRDDVLDDYDHDFYEAIESSVKGYRIWVGIPQTLDRFNLMATVEHEVGHLQHPSMTHDLMPSIEDLVALWKDMATE